MRGKLVDDFPGVHVIQKLIKKSMVARFDLGDDLRPAIEQVSEAAFSHAPERVWTAYARHPVDERSVETSLPTDALNYPRYRAAAVGRNDIRLVC